ncbi:MAG TPA: MoaD/ThiS family protein, partial [Blastocatellia bacterium]|nr:MoaD/ThiS family protein [Blastocatellia bacterium]
MNSVVHIPSALRRFTDDEGRVAVAAATAGEALDAIVTRFPMLKRHLYTDDGVLRSFVNVYVNDEDIRHLDGLATVVGARDEIHIIPSIAVGSAVADTVELSNEEIQRYSRHLLL